MDPRIEKIIHACWRKVAEVMGDKILQTSWVKGPFKTLTKMKEA